jgi:hypothetical protein
LLPLLARDVIGPHNDPGAILGYVRVKLKTQGAYPDWLYRFVSHLTSFTVPWKVG